MRPEDLELLVTREMPFGKHKGRLIADLPGNYLNWFARSGFPPGEIGRLLALMQEIDHNGLKDILAPLRPRSPATKPGGSLAGTRKGPAGIAPAFVSGADDDVPRRYQP